MRHQRDEAWIVMDGLEAGIICDTSRNPRWQAVFDGLAQKRQRLPHLAASREKASQVVSGLGSFWLIGSKDSGLDIQRLAKQLLGFLSSA